MAMTTICAEGASKRVIATTDAVEGIVTLSIVHGAAAGREEVSGIAVHLDPCSAGALSQALDEMARRAEAVAQSAARIKSLLASAHSACRAEQETAFPAIDGEREGRE